MKKLFARIIICSILLAAFAAAGFASGPGTSAANFLKFGIGARPAGMGGAFTAVADDVNSLYWNPAGLSTYNYKEASLMHNELGEGMRLETAGFSMPVKKLGGSFGVSYSLFTISDIQGYDALGARTGDVSVSDKAFTLGYGANLGPGFSAGLALKSLNEQLDKYDASTYAADAGLLYKLDRMESRLLNKLSLALVTRNIGSGMKFIEESSPLPSVMTAAVAYDGLLYENRLIVALDFNAPSDYDRYFNAGIEYTVSEMIALRCGYQSKDDLAGGFRAGIGMRVRNASLDYGYVPRGDFGSSHRMSFGFRFGTQYDELLALRKITQQYEKGVKYYKKGDLVNAHRQLRNVLLVAPGHEQAKEYIEKTEMRIDEIQEKNSAEQHMARGIKYFDERKLGDAQAEFESVLSIDRHNRKAAEYMVKIRSVLESLAGSLYNRGVIQYDKGDYTQAVETMEKVLVIMPFHSKADEYIVRAKEEIENVEQTKQDRLEEENKAARQKKAQKLYGEGMSLYGQKKWQDARAKFAEALDADPGHEEAAGHLGLAGKFAAQEYVNRGKKALENGSFAEAGIAFEKALLFEPDNIEALEHSSRAREGLKNENRAKAFICNREALTAYSNGDREKAVELWEKAVQYDPSMEEALNSLNRAKKEIAQ